MRQLKRRRPYPLIEKEYANDVAVGAAVSGTVVAYVGRRSAATFRDSGAPVGGTVAACVGAVVGGAFAACVGAAVGGTVAACVGAAVGDAVPACGSAIVPAHTHSYENEYENEYEKGVAFGATVGALVGAVVGAVVAALDTFVSCRRARRAEG